MTVPIKKKILEGHNCSWYQSLKIRVIPQNIVVSLNMHVLDSVIHSFSPQAGMSSSSHHYINNLLWVLNKCALRVFSLLQKEVVNFPICCLMHTNTDWFLSSSWKCSRKSQLVWTEIKAKEEATTVEVFEKLFHLKTCRALQRKWLYPHCCY